MAENDQLRNIVFWGLPGSGKTSFILAFLKALRVFGPDMGWNINLPSPRDSANEEFQKKILANFIEKNELPLSTQMQTHIALDLYCNQNSKKPFFWHSLRLVDVSGRSIYGDEKYLKEISNTDALIISLDSSNQNQSYLRALPALQDYVQVNRNKQLKVALCLSKTDQYFSYIDVQEVLKVSHKRQQLSIRDKIESIIGRDVLVSLEQTLFGSKIQYFLTSTVGWIKAKHGGYFPNCTAVMGGANPIIYNPVFWKPIGIMETFFWLLDELDLGILDPDMRNLRYETLIKLYWRWFETDKSLDFYRSLNRD